jgi:hypothetical protein
VLYAAVSRTSPNWERLLLANVSDVTAVLQESDDGSAVKNEKYVETFCFVA